MADTAVRKMTADEFLAWAEAQADQRFEFIDGAPVAMAGASDRHDQIVVNLIAGLAPRLRGTPCAPRTADQAVKTMSSQRVRRPDVLVDCGPRPPKGLFAPNPTLVFEVHSPSTKKETISDKLAEYQAIGSIRHVVLLYQDQAFIQHYARAANDEWVKQELAELSAVLKLATINVELPLSEIYTDVEFDAVSEA
jgi:Uma2 family endonuclease